MTRLALGTAQLAMPYGVANRSGPPSRDDAHRILAAAIGAGVRAIDTAPAYGEAESILGEHFARYGRPSDLVVVTKLSGLPPGLAPADLRSRVAASIDGSRRRLRSNDLDVYLAHAEADLDAYGDGLADALGEARRRGVVRAIGASIYDPRPIPECFDALELPFNVFDRRIAPPRELEMTFARSALLQGAVTLDPDALAPSLSALGPLLRELRAVASSHGVSIPRAAIGYARARSPTRHVIVGAESMSQLEDTLACFEGALPPGLAGELDRRFAGVPAEMVDPRRFQPGARTSPRFGLTIEAPSQRTGRLEHDPVDGSS
jgi:aryl-alcohol dehydrogenase-like predicted oxidoreductase